jgi:hypothetical protein
MPPLPYPSEQELSELREKQVEEAIDYFALDRVFGGADGGSVAGNGSSAEPAAG